MHEDDFVAAAEDGQLDHLEQVFENSMEIKRVGRIGPGRSSTGKVLKRVVHWSGEGFTWEADPRLIEKLINMLNLSGGKGALTLGGKDIGRDVRDSDCELKYSEAKLVQAAAGLEQYIALDRPDIAYSVGRERWHWDCIAPRLWTTSGFGCRRKVSVKALRLRKHPTETNTADLATKYLTGPRMECCWRQAISS